MLKPLPKHLEQQKVPTIASNLILSSGNIILHTKKKVVLRRGGGHFGTYSKDLPVRLLLLHSVSIKSNGIEHNPFEVC